MCDNSLLPRSLKMCLDSASSCFERIHFAGRVICCRCFVRSPVIQNLWHMSDLSGFFYAAENKIMILCSVKLLPESSNFTYYRLSYNKKVADIVIGTQKVKVKIRFQMGLKMLIQFGSYLVFICIDSICIRIIFQITCNLIKSIWGKQVIMIKNSCILSLYHLKCCICISCNSQILIQYFYTDSAVLIRIFVQNSLHFLIFRTSVRNAEFPVTVCLCQQRINHLAQKNFRCTKCRNSHADQRAVGKLVFSLFFQFCIIRNIGLIPRTIRYFFRFKAFMKTYPEFLRTIMFEITQSLTDRVRIKLFQHSCPLDMSCHFFVFAHNLSVSSDAAFTLLIPE